MNSAAEVAAWKYLAAPAGLGPVDQTPSLKIHKSLLTYSKEKYLLINWSKNILFIFSLPEIQLKF